jgi:uncharacterized repeat protein (TIGR01451 family)
MEYLIQFQNTGTDTAYQIVIVDTLSSLFHYATFNLLSNSHPATWQLSPRGTLTLTFKNINLLDSLHNEPRSHGYFKYEIKLKDTIATGTALSNTAAIYFDYNAPVLTNASTHYIGQDYLRNCLIKPTSTIALTGCRTSTLTFTANPTNAGANPTYQWFKNTSTTPIATTRTYTTTDTTTGNKFYCKVTISSELCSEYTTFTTDTIKVNCFGVATSDLGIVQHLGIYPNPNDGTFQVRMTLAQPSMVGLSVVNMLGQVLYVRESDLLGGEAVMDIGLSSLPQGIYFLVAKVGTQVTSRKLVIGNW